MLRFRECVSKKVQIVDVDSSDLIGDADAYPGANMLELWRKFVLKFATASRQIMDQNNAFHSQAVSGQTDKRVNEQNEGVRETNREKTVRHTHR
jgi:hypothetical protein